MAIYELWLVRAGTILDYTWYEYGYKYIQLVKGHDCSLVRATFQVVITSNANLALMVFSRGLAGRPQQQISDLIYYKQQTWACTVKTAYNIYSPFLLFSRFAFMYYIPKCPTFFLSGAGQINYWLKLISWWIPTQTDDEASCGPFWGLIALTWFDHVWPVPIGLKGGYIPNSNGLLYHLCIDMF